MGNDDTSEPHAGQTLVAASVLGLTADASSAFARTDPLDAEAELARRKEARLPDRRARGDRLAAI